MASTVRRYWLLDRWQALGPFSCIRYICGCRPSLDERELVPWHPTLGDVDSADALAAYQAAKREHKAEWSKARAAS